MLGLTVFCKYKSHFERFEPLQILDYVHLRYFSSSYQVSGWTASIWAKLRNFRLAVISLFRIRSFQGSRRDLQSFLQNPNQFLLWPSFIFFRRGNKSTNLDMGDRRDRQFSTRPWIMRQKPLGRNGIRFRHRHFAIGVKQRQNFLQFVTTDREIAVISADFVPAICSEFTYSIYRLFMFQAIAISTVWHVFMSKNLDLERSIGAGHGGTPWS